MLNLNFLVVKNDDVIVTACQAHIELSLAAVGGVFFSRE
jgi:hypothetical protein